MSNQLGHRWLPSNDEILYKCEYFTLVKTTEKKLGGYCYKDSIRITSNAFCKKTTFAHEYVHMVENHKGVNNPSYEYLANRVSAILAKHYKWDGLQIASHNMVLWQKKLTNNEVSKLKVEAKKLAQSFLVDEFFQDGLKHLESSLMEVKI